MRLSQISVPDVYKRESSDFRFFLEWIEESLQKIKFDHDHAVDLYDPLRCPRQLLWMLADTMGYRYDDRLPPAFCRLVLLYFMSMIRLKGSKNGVMLAAEVNLAQFNLKEYGRENEILYDRLEDSSIPVNSVSVVSHVEEGYIDIAYFSEQRPIDACLEYVRPVGMYIFPRAGITIHAHTKIWVDGLLTNSNDMKLSIGPTHIGHYSREDYARLQKMREEHKSLKPDGSVDKDHHTSEVDETHVRKPVWYRNEKFEVTPGSDINPGKRALYNLQLSNNEHIVKSLLPTMFSQGYGPQPGATESDEYYEQNQDMRDDRPWDMKNLRVRDIHNGFEDGWSYLDTSRPQKFDSPKPRVNPILATLGDAIAMNPNPLEKYANNKYTKSDDPNNTGKDISVKNQDQV